MKKIVLDSSIIIDFLRRKDKEASTLVKLVEKGYQLSCSLITISELYAGKHIWEDKTMMLALESILSEITVFPLDIDSMIYAGKLRALYSIDLIDAIIAATALQHKLPLATLNTKDFKKVKGLVLFKH